MNVHTIRSLSWHNYSGFALVVFKSTDQYVIKAQLVFNRFSKSFLNCLNGSVWTLGHQHMYHPLILCLSESMGVFHCSFVFQKWKLGYMNRGNIANLATEPFLRYFAYALGQYLFTLWSTVSFATHGWIVAPENSELIWQLFTHHQ